MATSIVARSVACFLSVVFAFAIMATAQTVGSVAPTNSTLPNSETSPSLILQLSGGPLSEASNSYNVVPLTVEQGKGSTAAQVSGTNIIGALRRADSQNVNDLNTTDVAFITCDPNGSNIDASTVVQSAGVIRPKAIVLYSFVAQSCNLTALYDYKAIFSMVSQRDSQALMSTIALFPQGPTSATPGATTLTARIAPNSTIPNQGSSPSDTSNQGGPAPTTAVAMSILYSITGIITLLFLIIIATGAIRAHRHPERYGPRNGLPGRPRQSRAKGLARAMLETLPIVKFGDPEPAKPVHSEIELEDGQSHTTGRGVESTGDGKTPTHPVASGMGAAQAGSVHSGEAAVAAPEENLGCSICTEDFTTGEDVRVLPCNHKYHPGCIDPWLLNVSGTCPLCRHDLRPVTSATSNTEGTDPTSSTSAEGSELPPPLMAAEAGSQHSSDQHRNRISRFLDITRLRHAPPDERIAALRQLREQSQLEGQVEPAEDTEERSRRARLTGRLRDTFRIKTRTT